MPTPATIQRPGRVFGLDALRAAAILLVLAAHTWPSTNGTKWGTIAGVLGVEIFFALSGFLIGSILIDLTDTGRFQTWSHLTHFWRRRWYRTLPAYYLFLGLYMAWRSWLEGYPGVFDTFADYFLFAQNFHHGPGYLFAESWSLAIEEWFYLLFPLCLWGGLRLANRSRKVWPILIGLFVFIPWLIKSWAVWRVAQLHPNLSISDGREVWMLEFRRTVILRLDVPMYGVTGAVIAARLPVVWRILGRFWWLALVPLSIAIGSLTVNWPLEYGHLGTGLLIWPCLGIGSTLLVCRCCFLTELPGPWAGFIPVIAKLSYALYLCHGLILIILKKFPGPKSPWHLPPHTWLWTTTVWVLAFTVASVVYRWYEKPMMDLRDQPRSPVSLS